METEKLEKQLEKGTGLFRDRTGKMDGMRIIRFIGFWTVLVPLIYIIAIAISKALQTSREVITWEEMIFALGFLFVVAIIIFAPNMIKKWAENVDLKDILDKIK